MSAFSKEAFEQIVARSNSNPPVVAMPKPAGIDRELRELRDLIMQQDKAQIQMKPVVLPAPQMAAATPVPAAVVMAPPPPPPLPLQTHDLKKEIQSLLPPPVRIPAPPVFNITQSPPIMVAPMYNGVIPQAPEEKAPEPECSEIEGPLPRCKRVRPPVKCLRKGKASVGVVGGGAEDMDPVDDDCTTDIPIKEEEPEEPPCEDCDKPGKFHHTEFDPKALLERLCAGGKCATNDDRQGVANGNVQVPPNVPFKNGGWTKPSLGG
jgi:hypothetical protein